MNYTGWLLYGGPEKIKNCVKVVPSINKFSYQTLKCISLATHNPPDLLCSASHKPDLASMKDAPIFSKILSEISQIDIKWPNFLSEYMFIV